MMSPRVPHDLPMDALCLPHVTLLCSLTCCPPCCRASGGKRVACAPFKGLRQVGAATRKGAKAISRQHLARCRTFCDASRS